ncbi:MAG: hypothetical protein D6731_09650 [Planctomycetota bacterium]|nr:MAG: hypothetical protein D6731_09650 [Planctomycetota bacterium]
MRNPTTAAAIALGSASLLTWLAGGALAEGGHDLAARLRALDANGDGVLQRDEAPVPDWLFARGDRDGDGRLDPAEARAVARLRRAAAKVARGGQEKLRQRFAKSDRNGDGVVSREEFPAGDELFSRFDRDGDGRVDRGEALAFAVEEELTEFFGKHDADLSGTLSPAEVPGEEAREVLRAADADGDGEVTGEEAFAFVYHARRDGVGEDGRATAPEGGAKGAARSGGGERRAGEGAVAKLGVLAVLEARFADLDRDGDGRLGPGEFPASSAVRSEMDLDGDGAVDRAELRVRFRVAGDLGRRGERVRDLARSLGLESELAALGVEIKALFQAGRYAEVGRLLDRAELLCERRRSEGGAR